MPYPLPSNIQYVSIPDFPPPPPEAFQPDDEDEPKQVQSRTFKYLQDTVNSGGQLLCCGTPPPLPSPAPPPTPPCVSYILSLQESLTQFIFNLISSLLESAPSVFSRATEDRNKPSTTPLPPMYRPKPPVIKPAAQSRPVGPSPVMARPGQPAPVALPGMVEMEPVHASRGPVPQPSVPHSHPTPPRAPSSPPQAAPSSARIPSSPTGQQEIKRTPIKPGGSQPVPEGTRTPYCAACGEEIL